MVKLIASMVAVILLVSLALLHWVAPSIIEGAQNTVQTHSPYPISETAKKLHQDLFIVDLHTDSLLWKRDLSRQSDIGHIDLPSLKQGNVSIQVFSATTKSPSGQNYDSNTADSDNITLLAMAQLWPIRTWSSIFERAMYQLDKLLSLTAESDNKLILIKNKSDLTSLIEGRESNPNLTGAMFLIEGAHPLEGDIDNLNKLYDKGLRFVGLTHFFDNRLGGSLHGVSGDGLTEFGKSVIQRADELEMTIDVAHASPQMVKDVLAMSTRPVILSHGGFKGNCDSARNLSDELMQQIAAKGGIIGVGYWDGAICDFSPAGIVQAIRYGIDLMGLQHIALGSDYDGTVHTSFDTSELAILTQTMLDQNFTETEIRAVMGGNVRDFLMAQLPEQ